MRVGRWVMYMYSNSSILHVENQVNLMYCIFCPAYQRYSINNFGIIIL